MNNLKTACQRHCLAALAAGTALLAACGSGDGPAPQGNPPPPTVEVHESRVVVVGDSLADVGAFGAKATIQNSADPAAGFPIFPEIVAQGFGDTSQCNYYTYDSVRESFTTRARCRNFAVGGSRIVNPAARGGAAVPLNIPTQLAAAVARAGGSWRESDVLLVDGGANDLADLAAAFIGASRGRVEEYRAFLLQQLDASAVDPLLATGTDIDGLAAAGSLYMHALADTYYGAIKAQALDRGATRVALLNIPDVTLTPRVRAALAIVAANISQAHADAVQATVHEWATSYNAQLEARVGDDARVTLVDFYTDFTDQITNAGQYGITNASAASCPSSGVDGMGLPRFVLEACTSAALDAAPPEGLAAGWWRSWAFADDFHLTPYGHELLAATINRALVESGWL